METKEVKIVPPEGYEIDKENSTLECIKFKPNNKKILLTAADRGKIDEIIMALTTLGQEKMINYNKEIDFLNNIRKL